MDQIFFELIYQVALFQIAMASKVDFFELERCETVEQYNRECPLAQLDQHLFELFKKTAKDKRYEKIIRKQNG